MARRLADGVGEAGSSLEVVEIQGVAAFDDGRSVPEICTIVSVLLVWRGPRGAPYNIAPRKVIAKSAKVASAAEGAASSM